MSYTVQNVVFPAERDPDILPLYVDPETWATVDDVPVRLSQRAHMSNVLSRSSARILPGRRVSFATYFNAFPASYWQHWTNVREVTLRIRTSGPGTVLVYRSNGQGISQRVESREVTGDATTTLALPLSTFGDGGWYWFDIMADDEPLTFSRGEWSVEVDPVRAGKASLGITTFNKPVYCVETLRALGENPDVLAELDVDVPYLGLHSAERGIAEIAEDQVHGARLITEHLGRQGHLDVHRDRSGLGGRVGQVDHGR